MVCEMAGSHVNHSPFPLCPLIPTTLLHCHLPWRLSYLHLSTSGTIYCSEVTAALVVGKMGVQPQFVRALPLHKPTVIQVLCGCFSESTAVIPARTCNHSLSHTHTLLPACLCETHTRSHTFSHAPPPYFAASVPYIHTGCGGDAFGREPLSGSGPVPLPDPPVTVTAGAAAAGQQ